MKWLDKLCERGQWCSCWFDGIKNPFTKKYIIYYGECCKEHDDCYSKLTDESTKECDEQFAKCLKKHISIFGYWLYAGVRVFGRWFK